MLFAPQSVKAGRACLIAACLLIAWQLTSPAALAEGNPAREAEGTLVLREALQRPMADGEPKWAGPGGGGRPDLTVRLTRREGQWLEDVYAHAEGYNHGLHPGTIRAQWEDEPVTIELDLTLRRAGARIDGHPPGPEGRGRYTVTLSRDAAGRWSGTYEGRSPGRDAMTGQASLSVHEPWLERVDAHEPVQAGEHPRLFIREPHLDTLRQRAETELGRKFTARMRQLLQRNRNGFTWSGVRHGETAAPYTEGFHAAGHAFLYALTGDIDLWESNVRLWSTP